MVETESMSVCQTVAAKNVDLLCVFSSGFKRLPDIKGIVTPRISSQEAT